MPTTEEDIAVLRRESHYLELEEAYNIFRSIGVSFHSRTPGKTPYESFREATHIVRMHTDKAQQEYLYYLPKKPNECGVSIDDGMGFIMDCVEDTKYEAVLKLVVGRKGRTAECVECAYEIPLLALASEAAQ